MSIHTREETARYLNSLVEYTDSDGRGPDAPTRRRWCNMYYSSADSNAFNGGGFYSWGGENHFCDQVDRRAYLAELGFRVLMERQPMLDGRRRTRFNPNLKITLNPGKRLVRVADRPDLWALYVEATRVVDDVELSPDGDVDMRGGQELERPDHVDALAQIRGIELPVPVTGSISDEAHILEQLLRVLDQLGIISDRTTVD